MEASKDGGKQSGGTIDGKFGKSGRRQTRHMETAGPAGEDGLLAVFDAYTGFVVFFRIQICAYVGSAIGV
jgi:hypothetical protein